jgi:uncharacterized protein YdaU (DUF1376 family)
MAEFPALTLWTDAYLSDTRCLTTIEHGAYLLLLMEAWRRPHCDLPDDDRILARLAGLTIDDWMEIKATILAFWTFDGRGKTWKQKRLMIERDRARVRSKSQSDKAVKRWSKTKHSDAAAYAGECPADATTATATATAIEEEPYGSPSLPPTPKKAKAKRSVGVDHQLPEGWSPALTERTASMTANWPPGMLEREEFTFRNHAAANGRLAKNWDAAFAMWLSKADERLIGNAYGNRPNQSPRNNNRSNDEPLNPFVRAAAERQAERAAHGEGQSGSGPDHGDGFEGMAGGPSD